MNKLLQTISLLVDIARDAESLLEGMEDSFNTDASRKLTQSLDTLLKLPDDKPGYTLSGPARAEWFLYQSLRAKVVVSAREEVQFLTDLIPKLADGVMNCSATIRFLEERIADIKAGRVITDKQRLDFLEDQLLEVSTSGVWDGDPAFSIVEVSGNRNDREFHSVGQGDTLRSAIDNSITKRIG